MHQRALIVGVMGGGTAEPADREMAYRLGFLIASQGWVLLNGGRNCGIMAASAKGAKTAGGLTVGILPDADAAQVSADIDIPICTGMGSARNAINVLSSDIVVACSGGAGTLSEIALALKAGTPVILLHRETVPHLEAYRDAGLLHHVADPEAAIARIRRLTTA